MEAPEGALKDRYDLLLRPCVDGIDRVHRCTYDILHFYGLIDWDIFCIFCILFSCSVSHINGRAPFPPIEIIRWWPKLREEARSTSGWKHEDVMMSCACHAHMPHARISLEADVFLASEDGETLLDENGKTVLGAFECGAFTI